MAEQITGPVAVLYSTGEDSSVLLHLMTRFFPADRIIPIFLYTCRGIGYKERFISQIGKQYGLEIRYYPDYNISELLRREGRRVKRITYGQMLSGIRADFSIEYVAIGWVKGESMGRACAMKTYDNGIDWRDKKLFPLHDWNKKDVRAYIKANRILLAPECYQGFRNIDIYQGESLLWLKHNHPEDYQTWVKTYPMSEAELCD